MSVKQEKMAKTEQAANVRKRPEREGILEGCPIRTTRSSRKFQFQVVPVVRVVKQGSLLLPLVQVVNGES